MLFQAPRAMVRSAPRKEDKHFANHEESRPDKKPFIFWSCASTAHCLYDLEHRKRGMLYEQGVRHVELW